MKTHKENIDEYNQNPNLCKYCNKPILANYDDSISNIKRKKFCNNSCSASYNNRLREKRIKTTNKCLVCGTEIKNGYKFCSNQCSSDYQYMQYIIKWKNGTIDGSTKSNLWKSYSKHIRRYLFEKYNSKCSRCGWGEENIYSHSIPLEVEHIDGNSQNNSEDNLTLLCPNCHSLTSTYRGLNKGSGTRNITWIPTQNVNKKK